MTSPPPPPPAQPRLRADGSVKGLSRGSAIALVVGGVVLLVASVVALVPAFVDQFSGPRFAVPGSRTIDLDAGTWTIYEHTRTDSDDDPVPGGLDLGLRASGVRIVGPAPVAVWDHDGASETITRGSRTYLGVVRFEIESGGSYTLTVAGEPGDSGEVMVARPLSDLFGRWPWILGAAGGIGLIVVGGALGATGATNRRVARAAGHPV